MPDLSAYWNGRVLGIPSLFFTGLQVAYGLLGDRISTLCWSSNLANFGEGSRVQRGVSIRSPGRISLGAKVNLGRGVQLGQELKSGLLEIGDGSQVNARCMLDFSGNLIIGRNVVISSECMIFTHSHGLDAKSIPVPTVLVIEDGVWIGARSIILPSVSRIGVGAIIGAGSVVTKDVANYCVVAGNPARLLHSIESEGR